ncbi:multidrug resistance protein 1 [Coprinopsis cinerea AmutBmut pab1-1]|nr:multidrug resistance protein 1 [Coprinopsis cinerea AmutBmut pab1-1]
MIELNAPSIYIAVLDFDSLPRRSFVTGVSTTLLSFSFNYRYHRSSAHGFLQPCPGQVARTIRKKPARVPRAGSPRRSLPHLQTPELKEKPDDDAADSKTEVKPAEPEIPPITFFQLFRFSTKFEIFIDIIGLIASAAAGAAQPLMSLLFGNLTQEFVIFGNVALEAQQGNQTAIAGLPAAAESFKRAAANNASYLVYIGMSSSPAISLH